MKRRIIAFLQVIKIISNELNDLKFANISSFYIKIKHFLNETFRLFLTYLLCCFKFFYIYKKY